MLNTKYTKYKKMIKALLHKDHISQVFKEQMKGEWPGGKYKAKKKKKQLA